MQIEMVACLATPDIEVPKVLAGFDVAVWQHILKHLIMNCCSSCSSLKRGSFLSGFKLIALRVFEMISLFVMNSSIVGRAWSQWSSSASGWSTNPEAVTL
jgi:hypothetical protein